MNYVKFLSSTLAVLWVLLGMSFNVSAQEKGVLIVNNSVEITAISKKNLRKIYSGKSFVWENKLMIKPCMLAFANDVTERFLKKVLKTSERKYQKVWLRKVYSGSSPAPPVLKTPEEVIKYVSGNDGGIGIVPQSAAGELENCRIINIDALETF